MNYFTGSGSFCRALRYWATTAPTAKQAAKRLAPSSNGFKLSDSVLVPVRKWALLALPPPSITVSPCVAPLFPERPSLLLLAGNVLLSQSHSACGHRHSRTSPSMC